VAVAVLEEAATAAVALLVAVPEAALARVAPVMARAVAPARPAATGMMRIFMVCSRRGVSLVAPPSGPALCANTRDAVEHL
jgi:hypothetical protein